MPTCRGITFASCLAGRNETWSLKTSGGSGTKESVKKNGRRPSRPASLLFSGFLHFSLAHSSREGNYGKNPSEDERDEEKRRGEAPPSVGGGGVSDLSQGGPVVKDKAVSIGSGWGGGGGGEVDHCHTECHCWRRNTPQNSSVAARKIALAPR